MSSGRDDALAILRHLDLPLDADAETEWKALEMGKNRALDPRTASVTWKLAVQEWKKEREKLRQWRRGT